MSAQDLARDLVLLLAGLAVCPPAHAAAVRHPAFPARVSSEDVEKLRENTSAVMGFSPERIAELIVPRTTFQNIFCPNCRGGNVEDIGRWIWSINDPGHIKCKYCGVVFPNDKFPLDKETTLTDTDGVVQHYRYWEGKDGYRFYLEMRIENCSKIYMEEAASQLARLYAGTGEGKYARQAAIILYRLAEVYPHYSPHGITDWATMAPIIHDIKQLPRPAGGVQPVPGLAQDVGRRTIFPYCSALRGDGSDNWFYGEMSTSLAYAYDQVAASPELDKLSAEKGRDVRLAIEEFFRAQANFSRTFPIYLSNMDPALISGLAAIGRVIGEPEFVHDALRRTRLLVSDIQFYPDGIWREGSPSYHQQTVTWVRQCLQGPLTGYSDPEGYANPEDGTHIENLQADKDVPFLRESVAALNLMRLPNGHPLTVHDTWSSTARGRRRDTQAQETFQTSLLWAMGQAILGLGSGPTGVQANLHFSGGYGHEHADNLDLILYSFGRELLPDVGYTHTILRPLASDSLAHNLVVVDKKAQRTSGGRVPSDGRLMAWAASGDVLRLCEAGAEGAYPEVVSTYRRALAIVALPESGAYVVDVFRVTGGSTHDYCLHGSADAAQTLASSAPLHPDPKALLPPGPESRPWLDVSKQGWQPVVNGVNILYGILDDVQAGPGTETATFTFSESGGPSLSTTLLGQPNTILYSATMPAIRRAREVNADILKYHTQMVLARRTGTNLQSVFAAVHEPWQGNRRLTRVARLPLENGGAGAVGIVCEGSGFTDYHLSGLQPDSDLRAAGLPLSATARYAFVRIAAGRPRTMVLVDGTDLRFGDRKLVAPPAPAGRVLEVYRKDAGNAEDALVVDAIMEPRASLPQQRAIVTFGDGSTYGLAVQAIRTKAGRSVIVLAHRPGFKLLPTGDGAEHTHHPHRKMEGPVTFRLPAMAVWQQEG